MERFPVELIYVLVFLGIVLFNYMMQQAARRRRQEQEAQAAARGGPPPAQKELPEHIWRRTLHSALPAVAGHVEPAHRAAAITAAPAAAARRTARRALFRSKGDLRHAMVVITVLGPCRALDPNDRR
jgi:hypothetical protein